ncbi:MAG: L-ribulose-5-phosphate 3-epimerase [Spirochaetaceae bacterium]|jgi:predicted hexulose-6-phosphate isomerase|nr:L-ribulose-5-phosphate 3-epimerase [Spirochaetaceae bacterium]
MPAYKLGLYEKAMPGNLSLVEKLTAVPEGGYDFLELSIDETDEKLARLDWTDAEIHQARRSIEHTGTPITSICLSAHRRFPLGDPDKVVRDQSIAIMEKAILLAARLGVRIIQIAGYDVYYKPSTDATCAFFAENLARSAEAAACLGIMLAFETMETPFINTVEKAIRWVNKINSPFLAVYPDLGNITCAAAGDSNRVQADLESGRGHIAALHLKETKPGIFREVLYGTGHVNFSEGVKTAWNLGVRSFTAEFWWTAGASAEWKVILQRNNQFLRKFFENRKAMQTETEQKRSEILR